MGLMQSQPIICEEFEDFHPPYEATMFWELHRTGWGTHARAAGPVLAPFLCALALPSEIAARERLGKVGKVE